MRLTCKSSKTGAYELLAFVVDGPRIVLIFKRLWLVFQDGAVVSGQNNVQGFKHVSLSIPTLQTGFCALTGDLDAASAIGGAIPGLGGVVGGVFGLISAACSLSKSASLPAGQ